MSERRQFIIAALLAGLAGCSTAPRAARNPGARVSQTVEKVSPGPRLAPPPTTVPQFPRPRSSYPAETWIPLDRWAREHGCGPLRRITGDAEDPEFSLATGNGEFIVQMNSRVAHWNGLELHLGFKPQFIDNHPCVHRLDLEKNFEPLMRGLPRPAGPPRIIVIDPGHGGQNRGAVSVVGGVCEKEFTLDWAKRLALLLAREGWHVFLTRTNDSDVSLPDRVAFAAEHHADLFISLHFNSAAPDRQEYGLETYCLTPTGMPSTLTRGYEDDTSAVFPNNAFDAENLEYAARFNRALLPVVGRDRGIRRARFLGVLRGQNRPAVLIEGGFLSNPREAGLIAQPAYRQKLAVALAKALAGKPGPEFTAGSGRFQSSPGRHDRLSAVP